MHLIYLGLKMQV